MVSFRRTDQCASSIALQQAPSTKLRSRTRQPMTNHQWAHPACPLVSLSKTKPCQISSVTTLCARLHKSFSKPRRSKYLLRGACTPTFWLVAWFGWWRGVVGSAFRLKRSYSTPGPVSTAMGDCLRAGKPSRCEACQLGRLSLLPSARR